MTQCFKIIVKGTVQGVGYRYATYLEAHKRGIVGIVRNQDDGSVYLEIETDEKTLKEFIVWLYEGPKNADVTEVQCSKTELKCYKEFSIVK